MAYGSTHSFFWAFIQAQFFLCRMSVLIYSLLDVCVMCCRGTPSPGSLVRVWRRRMMLRRDLGGRLEDSLTGNLWTASAQPRWRLATERFNKAQTSSAMIFVFMHRHTTVIKKEEQHLPFFPRAAEGQQGCCRCLHNIFTTYGIKLNWWVQNTNKQLALNHCKYYQD